MFKNLLNRFAANIKNDIGFRIIAIGLLSLVFFPWLLTRTWGFFHFNESTAWVGDTIGGVTGPISGFLGAVLVYLALKEQIKANTIITNQFKEQKKDEHSKKIISIVTDQLKMLREDLKDFEHTRIHRRHPQDIGFNIPIPPPTITNGTIAIGRYLSAYPILHDDSERMNFELATREISYFLRTISYLISLACEPAVDEYDQRNLLMLIYEVYTVKLEPPLKESEKRRESIQKDCSKCGKKHGIPESIYLYYDEINKQLNGGVFIRL